MALGQIKALVMVNKWVKFEDCSFNNLEVMGKVKVFHDSDTNADNTGVMTIPRLLFFEKKSQATCNNTILL